MNLAGNRILVCGGRDFTDYPLLCGTLGCHRCEPCEHKPCQHLTPETVGEQRRLGRAARNPGSVGL
jgi:hypothetical protein